MNHQHVLIFGHGDHRFYDRLSRLLEADYNNGATIYNYGYDVAGNLVNYDGVTRTYNAANQMVNDGTNTLTYDNNGNLRTVGSDTYMCGHCCGLEWHQQRHWRTIPCYHPPCVTVSQTLSQ
ncbi:MAG: hypothetical protein ACFE0Q_00530 [Anaerolineae bacterium]